MEKKDVKQCKKCKEEINKKAKKCPKCGAKQGMPVWLIILIAFIAIGIIASFNGGDDTSSSSVNSNSKAEKKEIAYTKISVDDLEDALEANAAAAKDKYNKQYLEITGKLGTIDSDLKYISLLSRTDEWDIVGIHCTLKTEDQKNVVKSLQKDQNITVKGQITNVGEVLGYYLNVTEIIPN